MSRCLHNSNLEDFCIEGERDMEKWPKTLPGNNSEAKWPKTVPPGIGTKNCLVFNFCG